MCKFTKEYRVIFRNLCSGVVLIAALSAWPRTALPCSPGFTLDRHSPKTGTVVPTNAVLHVVGPTRLAEASMSSGTMQMNLDVTWTQDQSLWQLNDLAQIPLAGLVPNQTVTVALSGGFGGSTSLTLTASTSEDHTPPVFIDTATVTYTYREAGPSSACHPWDHFRVSYASEGAYDNFGVSAYAIYEELPGGRKLVGTTLHDTTTQPVNSLVPFYVTPDEGQRCFSLVAFDFAGNISTPQRTCLQMQKPGNQVDAGTLPSADAGTSAPNSDGGTPSPADASTLNQASGTGGCSCTTNVVLATSPSVFLGLLLLAGMILVRRRN